MVPQRRGFRVKPDRLRGPNHDLAWCDELASWQNQQATWDRAVTAKREKMLRAEPISALYEQYRVHHVGTFLELEDQMCTYCGGGGSPDRLDAAVYALTDLMLGYQPVEIPIVVPFVAGTPRHNPFSVFTQIMILRELMLTFEHQVSR